MKEKILEINYDHYKDTFEHLQKYLKRRDWYIIVAIILITVILFQISNENILSNIINELIKVHLKLTSAIDFAYINSILLFAFLITILKYYQITIFINRQYEYIHNIEDALFSKFEGLKITREGKSYLEHYPWLLSFSHAIYTILFPLIILGVICIKSVSEFNTYWEVNKLFFFINEIILAVILVLTILYLIWIHTEDFEKKP